MSKIDPGLMTDWEKSIPHHQMIYVQGGSFMMGGSDEEAYDREKPIHQVTLNDFYLGQYPVTQALWQAVMGNNPSRFEGEDRPVENVSWEDSQRFIKKLNSQTGKKYCLPTEAQWEFAARGGIHCEEYLYSGSDKLKEVGWYEENSGRETHPVGKKLGNELDLYDMSGNVWEWVEDQWHDTYEGSPADGSAWVDLDTGFRRVIRGGSLGMTARRCQASYRDPRRPGTRNYAFGFRLARSL